LFKVRSQVLAKCKITHFNNFLKDTTAENQAHSSLNAPDPQAQDLAAIFNGFGAVRLNFGAKPASKLVPSSSIPLPAGLQQSKIADTVCKNSILETVGSWDGFQKP